MSSKLKSPEQSVSIRSPMEKHMQSPSRSTGKRSAAASETSSVSGGNGKISFSSPTSSKAGSRSNTPMKESTSKASSASSLKAKSAQKTAAANKRKIADLEAQEVEHKAVLEKLRADQKRVKGRLTKMEEEAAKVKFPVKDELLESIIAASAVTTGAKKAATTELPPRKDIPSAVLQLSSMLPEETVNDAMLVWDFLNVFSKTLSINVISWEDFVDLMSHTSRSSVALLDVYCALLKLLFSDSTALAKLNALLPRKVNYAYRQQGELDLNPTGEVDFNMVDLLAQEDFDCAYNGLKLLPRKLKADSVDILRCQVILRSIVLRLEPVRQLRKAVLDVTNAAHLSYTTSEPYVEHEELDALVGLASAYKRQRTRTPGQKLNSVAMTAVKRAATDSAEPPQTAQKVISSVSMAAINTPKATKSTKHVSGLDKDAIFQITSDVSAPLKAIYDAAAALETQELHQLKVQHKLVLLKALIDACYETVRIKQLLVRNAEERAVQVQNMAKAMKDQKLKQKEVSATKREAAFQACRKINQAAAEAEAARLAELEKKKSLSASKKKKKAPATPTPAAEPAAKGKGGAKGKSKAAAATKNDEKKGPGGGKDGLDPTLEQLYAMIDEMVILENAGVEVVEEYPMDAPTEEEEEAMDGDNSDDEEFEYDQRGNLIQRAKRQRRVTSATRAKALDRKRVNAERRQRQVLVQIAEERLSRALESRSERELRAAIKHAEKSPCKGYNDEGKATCTPLMKQVYIKLHEIEVQAKEDRQTSQYERALQEYFVRTTPIGSDRRHTTYWSFVGDDRLFVQTRESLSPEAEALCPRPPNSGKDSDACLARLFDSRPNRFQYKWSVYSSPNEQWLLWDALDERGEREKALKAAIKARFDIEEPKQVYNTTGSAHIGKRVKRTFGKKIVYGLIVGWLPASQGEEALWHVQHLDGDEEDLDEAEVLEYLVQTEEDLADAANATAAGAGASSKEAIDLSDETDVPVKKSGSSSSLASRSAVSASVPAAAKKSVITDSDDEAEFDAEAEEVEEKAKVVVPRIVALQSGLYRGTPSWRAPPLSNAIGAAGVRLELTRVLTVMNDELKFRNGQFSRENRKLWDGTLRDAQNAEELRGPLLELEALVRNLQTVEDKRDAEEVRLAKEVEKKEMIEEGWIFENDVNNYIGKGARRFFKGFGSSDGVIVAYLPPEKNENVALYHMEHHDGDSEDLELHDLLPAFRYFESDAQEEEDDGEGSDNEDNDGSESEAEDSADEEEEEEENALHATGAGATLWPTYEVRARWIAALSQAVTLGEVALALQAFLEQATAFGMVIPDLTVTSEKALAPRTARQAAVFAIKESMKDSYVESAEFARNSRLTSSNPSSSSNRSSHSRVAKSKSNNKAKFNGGGRERLSRAAAGGVKFYAE